MNAFSQWLAPDVLRALGLSLAHFIWQGAAIAAIAAAAMAVARKSSARYAIGVSALALMMAAPVVTYLVLHQSESFTAETPIPCPHQRRFCCMLRTQRRSRRQRRWQPTQFSPATRSTGS